MKAAPKRPRSPSKKSKNLSFLECITMPRKPTKGKSKQRKAAGKRRAPRKARDTNLRDKASASVKISLTDPQGAPFVVNRMYDLHAITLAQYPRAVQIAGAYQFYRIKQVALTYKIGYDTYQAVAGGPTRPQFYFMLDKSQSIPQNVALEGLKQMGARPSACDEKPIVRSWSPTVLTEEQTIGGPTAAKYMTSPWLNTNGNNLGAFNASTVQHNGIYWYVQMDATGGVNYQYTVEMEIQFEYKKPLWTQSTSSVASQGAVPALTNNSPDGLVGGADEQVATVYSLTGTAQPTLH